jgi:hypothetical protein
MHSKWRQTTLSNLHLRSDAEIGSESQPLKKILAFRKLAGAVRLIIQPCVSVCRKYSTFGFELGLLLNCHKIVVIEGSFLCSVLCDRNCLERLTLPLCSSSLQLWEQ